MDGIGITVVELMLRVVRGYLFAGLIVSIPFVIFGVQRVDPDATGWSVGFRLIIIPGLCAFWPLFAVRWVRGQRAPTETTAHRRAALSVPHP